MVGYPILLGSRVWPFRVTWRHRSRDQWIPQSCLVIHSLSGNISVCCKRIRSDNQLASKTWKQAVRGCGSLAADNRHLESTPLVGRPVPEIIVVWNFQDDGFYDAITDVIRSGSIIIESVLHIDEHCVLKYRLIPTRTAREEAFWKCGQTDRPVLELT